MANTAEEAKVNNQIIENLFNKCEASIKAFDNLIEKAKNLTKKKIVKDGSIDNALLEKEQFLCHGFSWLASYNFALREILNWAKNLEKNKKSFDLEKLILQSAFGEYLSQIIGGISMWQTEIIRAGDFGLTDEDINAFLIDEVKGLIKYGNTNDVRMQIAKHIVDNNYGNVGLEDETLEMIKAFIDASHLLKRFSII